MAGGEVELVQLTKRFGTFTAVGLLFCLFWSLMVGPAALALLPPSALRRPVSRSAAPSGRFRRAFEPLYRSPVRTLAVLALVTLAVGLGMARLRVQDSWLSGFAPESEFRRNTVRTNEIFNGGALRVRGFETTLNATPFHSASP